MDPHPISSIWPHLQVPWDQPAGESESSPDSPVPELGAGIHSSPATPTLSSRVLLASPISSHRLPSFLSRFRWPVQPPCANCDPSLSTSSISFLSFPETRGGGSHFRRPAEVEAKTEWPGRTKVTGAITFKINLPQRLCLSCHHSPADALSSCRTCSTSTRPTWTILCEKTHY